ncbi:NAD binding domain of 6-phosphogluconate dehydrogenase-domain-containing protein [Scenedesmus sp. NREL 46B-D3]|nr:NAD binding domain of 6-phosphogluconate dehydrogenase-domain-containing protein [Scenedesmus sp. NREL 46B-D3]
MYGIPHGCHVCPLSCLQGTIGFIGVGNMGAPMAANLLKAGLPVLVFDRNPAAVDKLVKLGAKAVGSPQELGETPGVTAVLSMLPSTDHVADAYEGPQGLLKASGGLQPSLLIDSSTILPTYTADLSQRIATHALLAPGARRVAGAPGPVLVDAPVSGGVIGAVAGSLTFMCGGSAAGVRAAKPLLQLMGRTVEHLGDPGAGQVAKICNNLAMAVEMAAVSEALALGAAMGLDPAALTGVINSSSARCWSSEAYNPVPGVLRDVPAAHDYRGGFNAGFMSKDLRLALQLAGTARQPLPMGERAAQLYQQVIDASGGEPLDFGAIYKYVYNGRPANCRPKKNNDKETV